MRKKIIENIKINEANYSSINPIDKNDVKRKRIRGKYIYERFYTIDFLDIKENSYVISSFGRIFSLIKNIEMKQDINKNRSGYCSVILSNRNGESRKYSISRLVALAFVPRTKLDNQLDRVYSHHKNWDNTYNYYWNIEWRSKTELNFMANIQNNKDMEEDKLAKIVCALLEKGTSIVDIFDIIERRFSKYKISRIKNRKMFTTISKDFYF